MKRCPKCGNTFPDEANFCPADAGRLELVTAGPSDGLIGGRFALVERIGGGRTGEVHRAQDTQTGKPCAIKLVRESIFPSPLLAQRTERELKQLEQLDSPYVVKVLAHGKQGIQLWVASELLAGGSLEQLLAAQGPQDPGRAAEIALAIGRGLADAARSGVVHRDLAPKNVLIDGAAVKLMNFGLPVPGGRDVQGVAEYVSPEQVEGKPVDQRCNIYSLGAIFYALLTGHPPFTGDVQAVHGRHLAGGAPPTQLGPEIDAVVLKALERQPSRRFMTLRQFLEELEKLGAQAAASTTSPMGLQGVDAGGIGGGKKKKAMAQTMMGGFQAIDAPPSPATTQKIGSPPVAPAPPVHVSPPSEAMPPPPVVPAIINPIPHVSSPMSTDPTQPVTAAPVSAGGPPLSPAPPVAAPLTAAPPPPSVSHPSMSKSNGQQPVAGKGKGKAEPGRKEGSKGKFRETMWFKKGELDAQAASQAAAEGAARPEAAPPDKADQLPIEDRYTDDGSLSTEDRGKYSLRTGHTQQMAAMRPDQVPRAGKGNVSEQDLIREVKGPPVLLYILIALIVIGGAVGAFFALR